MCKNKKEKNINELVFYCYSIYNINKLNLLGPFFKHFFITRGLKDAKKKSITFDEIKKRQQI